MHIDYCTVNGEVEAFDFCGIAVFKLKISDDWHNKNWIGKTDFRGTIFWAEW